MCVCGRGGGGGGEAESDPGGRKETKKSRLKTKYHLIK